MKPAVCVTSLQRCAVVKRLSLAVTCTGLFAPDWGQIGANQRRPLEAGSFVAIRERSGMKSRMLTSRTLIALLLSGAAASAQETIRPVIDRPITLPEGKFDLTLHGTYTNWGNSSSAGAGSSSLTGETLA